MCKVPTKDRATVHSNKDSSKVMKAYILYIDNEKSTRYKDECLASSSLYPDLEMIPVEGYNGEDAFVLSHSLNIGIIPHYSEQLQRGSRETNNAFCCTMGHYKIWKMIVESGEPSIVLEHDAIVKGSLSSHLINDDYDIFWLGYRVQSLDDYTYHDIEQTRVETDRFEGTHAYAVTPQGAQKLIDNLDRFGFNDSLDGQLGMRNLFELKMAIIDPCPIVALVGDRDSCIEFTGNPAQFNAPYTQAFLNGSRKDCLLPVRNVYLNKNIQFLESYKKIYNRIRCFSDQPISALILGVDEGTLSYKVSNDSLAHPDSRADIYVLQYAIEIDRQRFVSTQLVPYNVYFSRYYYKHTYVAAVREDLDFQIHHESRDLIFIDCSVMNSDETFRSILWANLTLKEDGLAVFYTSKFKMSEKHLHILRRYFIDIETIDDFVLVKK